MLSWLLEQLQILQPFLRPLCLLLAWLFLGLLAWNAWQFWREGLAITQRMHQIPCSRCQFFSGDYRLKCALHPDQAGTEAAICCPDFYG